MRKLHNERSSEQNVIVGVFYPQHQFIETYLKTKKAKFVWSVGAEQFVDSLGV